MKYGILGTGDNPSAVLWATRNGGRASHGTFADAAKFGERIFCCVQGIHALDALRMAGEENLAGKILIDQSNPFLYKEGNISLDPQYSGWNSLGEEVQKLLPRTKVVKTLNYLSYHLMTNPRQLPEAVTGFYCGNDKEAKAEVAKLLADFGWTDIMDLGDISISRYTEMLGAFWPAVYGQLRHMNWGFKLVR